MGNFEGMYLPANASGGLVGSEFGVMVSGKPLNDIPALQLTLEEHVEGAGEFHSISVSDGCMSGSAIVFGLLDNPFVARVSGSLDCATGYFDGWLDGQYTMFNISPTPTLFSGPFTAQFQLPQTLTDGIWDVSEGTSALTGGSSGGGKGSWTVDWTADHAPDASADPCAAIAPGDGGPRDGGVRRDSSIQGDAGVR